MLVAVAAFAALLAAGCTVPGSSRLQGPPEELPPSLHHVSADVLGFTLYDADPGSKLWAGLGEEQAEAMLAALHEPVFGEAKVDDWIGDHAGVALRELDLGETTATTLYFADAKRSKDTELRAAIGDAGYEARESDDVTGDWPLQFVRPTGEYRALAWFEDGAIVAARSTKALDTFLEAADEYSVADRKAMREYAVEAAARVPLAAVFRFDLVRTQLRRPFQDDPALLEFARWATDSNVLVALRDGWVGLAAPLEGEEGVRIVGASEWVPDLAPDIELRPVDREVLESLGADLDLAVAVHDPGQHLRELVRAITIGAGQYVTEQDVPEEEERVELLPVLDELDGDAAIGWGDGRLRAFVEDAEAAPIEAAFEHAGVNARVASERDGVIVEVPPRRSAATRNVVAARFLPDSAGAPPRPPVAWLWKAPGPCVGAATGWVTFDGTDELRFTVGVHGTGEGSCGDGIATRTAASLGLALTR